MSALNPVKFPEANLCLEKPAGMMDEECGSLWVYNDGSQCISCWKPTLLQRLQILLFGRVWLSIYSGDSQPPVWVSSSQTVFQQEKRVIQRKRR